MTDPYRVTDELYLWWLGQPRTVKSALSDAGVPICTW